MGKKEGIKAGRGFLEFTFTLVDSFQGKMGKSTGTSGAVSMRLLRVTNSRRLNRIFCVRAYHEEFGYFFGIDGAGYDFYEEHWIPLYKARGLHWHIQA